jgi:predicted nucleic acid-binding protein
MRALIDTNVLLDALTGREPWNAAAEKIVIAAADESFTALMTASSVTDIYYLIRKHTQDKDKAKREMMKLFEIIDILEVNSSDCVKAFELSMPDYEDALQAQCASRNMADCIVTRDKKGFKASPIPAVSPQDFLKKLKNKIPHNNV